MCPMSPSLVLEKEVGLLSVGLKLLPVKARSCGKSPVRLRLCKVIKVGATGSFETLDQ